MAKRDAALIAAYRRFAKQVVRQREIFLLALDGKHTLDSMTPPVNRSGAWYCLIRLHDAWAEFCRSAILLSAAGEVRRRNGVLVARSPLLGPGDDALVVLKNEWRRTKQPEAMQKQGPPVYLPSVAITAAQLLNIANLTQFMNGIGASNTNAPLELRACRNYLAHRHVDTALDPDLALLRIRIGSPTWTLNPDQIAARQLSGGITLFEEWCIDLELLASAAIA
jgi:hypothetical protein